MHKCITARLNTQEKNDFDTLASHTIAVARETMSHIRQGADNFYRGKVITWIMFEEKICIAVG